MRLIQIHSLSQESCVDLHKCFSTQDASSSLEPTNCALLVGVTYFCSALLGLVLKNLVGRRLLILASQANQIIDKLDQVNSADLLFEL